MILCFIIKTLVTSEEAIEEDLFKETCDQRWRLKENVCFYWWSVSSFAAGSVASPGIHPMLRAAWWWILPFYAVFRHLASLSMSIECRGQLQQYRLAWWPRLLPPWTAFSSWKSQSAERSWTPNEKDCLQSWECLSDVIQWASVFFQASWISPSRQRKSEPWLPASDLHTLSGKHTGLKKSFSLASAVFKQDTRLQCKYKKFIWTCSMFTRWTMCTYSFSYAK